MRERKNFCPVCGKEIDRGMEFCFDCRPRKSLEYKDVSIKYCLNCEKINTQVGWARYDSIDDALLNAIKKSVKAKDFEIVEAVIPEIEKKPGLTQEGELTLIYDEQEFKIPIIINVTTCDSCSKINDQYLEGIIQLRNCNPKIADYIWTEVERFKDKGVNINQHNEVRGGEDFVFNNKKVMRRIAQAINKKFKGEFKESAQHFSQDHQTGRVIYRLNILFRQTDAERDST